MRLTLALFLVCFTGWVHAQACEDLVVHGVWLDPFDNQKINLLCSNMSFENIYSYPGWKALDTEGNVIADEEVMYFGIGGTSYHVMDLAGPWQGGSDPVDLLLELWTGFGEELACTLNWAFHPQELLWTGNGDGGCFPAQVYAYANNIEGSALGVNLLDGAGNVVLSEVLVFDESTGYQDVSATFCLEQDACYSLALTSTPTEIITVGIKDPTELSAWNMNHWLMGLNQGAVTELDTTFQIDLYGGDCELMAVSAPARPDFDVYPNPSQGPVQLNFDGVFSDLRYHLVDLRGRCVRSGVLASGERRLDFGDLDRGTFLLHFVGDGQRFVQALVLE